MSTSRAPEERLLDLIKKAQHSLKMRKEVRIFAKINIILGVLIFFILGIFMTDVVRSHKRFSDFKKELDKIQTAQPVEIVGVNSSAPDIQKELELPVKSTAREEDSESVKDMISKLSLLGIVSGSDAEAVIKDKGSGKTYFLHKGEKLQGLKLLDISESSVTLEKKGKTYKLKL